MKKTLIVSLFILTSTYLLSQKVDFKKDLSPLINSKVYSKEGASKADIYIQQNSKSNGELTENAILLNYEKVYSAKLYKAHCLFKEGKDSREISIIENAFEQYKEVAESLSNCVSDAEEGKKNTENLINEIVEFKKVEEKRNAEIAQQAEIDRQKVIQDSINKSDKLKKELLERNQEIYRATNSGANDPLIVAKKYAEAYISGDIETLIRLGYVDSLTRKVGILKEKTINAYKADKSKFTPQSWKSEVSKIMINPRISRDFNMADYKKANVCKTSSEFDDLKQPLISIWYENENNANVRNIISFDYKDEYCNYLPNNQHEAGIVIKHRTISLIKQNGKWLVKDLY
jgi:hypothetical protein